MNMKKIILLILLSLTFSISSIAKKNKPVLKYSFELISKLNNDKAKLVSFKCSEPYDYDASFIRNFECNNETDERIFIEWENARIINSRVIFSDDRRINMDLPKADEAVSPHSNSILRDITGELFIKSDVILDLYNIKKLKQQLGYKNYVFIKIPIRFADNSVVEYEYRLTVWFETPSALKQ